jgi:hypothetical protein
MWGRTAGRYRRGRRRLSTRADDRAGLAAGAGFAGFLRGAAYGKVKAALGCFDERRLLLEPRWAESVLRGFGAPPGELRAVIQAKRFEGGPANGLA